MDDLSHSNPSHPNPSHSNPPDSLHPRRGSETAPSETAPDIVDVRRDTDSVAATTLIAEALHRSPDNVEERRTDFPDGRQVVSYCIHGREVSQGMAAALRLMGMEAEFFLAGGVHGLR